MGQCYDKGQFPPTCKNSGRDVNNDGVPPHVLGRPTFVVHHFVGLKDKITEQVCDHQSYQKISLFARKEVITHEGTCFQICSPYLLLHASLHCWLAGSRLIV